METKTSWTFPPLGEIALNVSETFDFQGREQVIFINTSDVLDGKFLHSDYSQPGSLPGQAKKIIGEKDILLSEIRPANRRFAFVDFSDTDDYVVSTKFMIIRTKGNYPPHYLYHVLTSGPSLAELQRIAESRSGTFPQITFDSIDYLPIPTPPKEHIGTITDFFGALDDKIELNRRMNRTLEAMAQATFKSWFVDFEPVKAKVAAKAAGASPEEIERAAMTAIAGKTEAELDQLPEPQQQSLARIAALFPDSFQESESGEIPEGWNAGKFGNIAENRRDGSNPSTLSPDTPYVGLEHLEKLRFSLFGWGAASDVDSQKSRFTKSDFLFGKLRPYFHKVCYPSMDGICSTDILVIRASNPDYFGIVGCQIFQPNFVEFANVRSTGTRMPRANWKDMANFPLVIPPSALAGKFTEIVTTHWNHSSSNVYQSRTLAQLRDTLLPKLLSGDLPVPAAQSQIEEALA